jgi:hypothetical protein
MTKELTKNNTFNLVYKREYVDSDSYQYDDYFPIYYTIFRNVPLSQLNRLNNRDFKNKVKAFCDKNYKETATNATGYSEVEILTGDEYYRTYADEFGTDIVGDDDSYFNDYGQLWNTRQFFKYDFAPDLTKSLDAQTYKNKLMREKGLYAN